MFKITGSAIFIGLFILSSSLHAASLYLAPGEWSSGQMFIDCEFDGHPERCLLDTGANHSFISSASDYARAYPASGQRETGGAAGTRARCDLVKIGSFGVGNPWLLERPGFEVTRCNERPENVIGIDALQGQVLELNFSNSDLNTVQQIPPRLPTQPLTVHPTGHISMEALLGGVTVSAFFDTGAGLTSVDQSWVEQHPMTFQYVMDLTGQDSLGLPVQMKLYRASEIRVAETSFRDVEVLAFDFESFKKHNPTFASIDLIVGYNMITQANWYLDLAQGHWAVQSTN